MDNPANSPHASALRRLGISGAQLQALCTYLQLLSAWNERVNLTGARTAEVQVAELVASVVPVADQPRPGRLIDVGSGNGSPGVVLAILRDDLEVTLLEPRVKRWAFLREVARACGCGLEVRRARHDGVDLEPAESVTLRALALPLGELASLVRPGGQVLVFGGHPRSEPPFRETERRALAKGDLYVFARE